MEKLFGMFMLTQLLMIQINAIDQPCDLSNPCPSQSTTTCSTQLNMCICNAGWILNCTTPAQPLTNAALAVTINEAYQFFTVEPNSLYNFLRFNFVIATTEATQQNIVATIWG
jgi:hypothetical protein